MNRMPAADPANRLPANLIIAKLALHLLCMGLIIAAILMEDRYGIACAKAKEYSFLDNFAAVLSLNRLLAAHRSLIVGAGGVILLLNLLINHRLIAYLLFALALLLAARQAHTHQRVIAERAAAFCGHAPSMGTTRRPAPASLPGPAAAAIAALPTRQARRGLLTPRPS